jgi:hypothetical protein
MHSNGQAAKPPRNSGLACAGATECTATSAGASLTCRRTTRRRFLVYVKLPSSPSTLLRSSAGDPAALAAAAGIRVSPFRAPKVADSAGGSLSRAAHAALRYDASASAREPNLLPAPHQTGEPGFRPKVEVRDRTSGLQSCEARWVASARATRATRAPARRRAWVGGVAAPLSEVIEAHSPSTLA